MILQVNTHEGVAEAGVAFFRRILSFVKKQYPDIRHEWLTPISGTLGTHVWTMRYPSLAAQEAQMTKLNADPAWQKLVKEAGPLDRLWTCWRVEFFNVQE